jgi:hypothetical protein
MVRHKQFAAGFLIACWLICAHLAPRALGASPLLLPAVDGDTRDWESNVFDRGREELVRRSVEMITTRGSVFTVYAIGQALQVASSATNVLSTARLRQTFQIEPKFQFTGDYGNDSFSPGQSLRVTRRFSAPTNYTVRVLATSYD